VRWLVGSLVSSVANVSLHICWLQGMSRKDAPTTRSFSSAASKRGDGTEAMHLPLCVYLLTSDQQSRAVTSPICVLVSILILSNPTRIEFASPTLLFRWFAGRR
jgi:hypothetical protein